ncbi:MAG TPA: phosphoserine phosphatase SerB [Caulobacteraceae bacterium]|jgi:phosphoserine phosphatase|nr:phosphoserine phosphatase SerB [Caulobacteraceae bacterium]
MHFALTLVSPDPEAVDAARSLVEQAVAGLGAHVKETRYLGLNCLDKHIEGSDAISLRKAAEAAIADLPVDVCVQPQAGRRKRLLVADMDSTIIGCECLDELADFAGKKAEIAAITERAMRGELAFEGALRERVGMLKGLETGALQRCYDERVRLNPGARTLVETMTAGGARCVLVSGGFEFFTGRVARAAGFGRHRANRLLEDHGRLTGMVAEPILGREAKLEALNAEAQSLGLALADTLAIGDGANDLAMIEAAGLGVAYRAKPIVAQQADARIDHSDLTALLYFQGYAAEEFIAAAG